MQTGRSINSVFGVVILDLESNAESTPCSPADSIFIYELSIHFDQHRAGLWISLDYSVGPGTILEFLVVSVDHVIIAVGQRQFRKPLKN